MANSKFVKNTSLTNIAGLLLWLDTELPTPGTNFPNAWTVDKVMNSDTTPPTVNKTIKYEVIYTPPNLASGKVGFPRNLAGNGGGIGIWRGLDSTAAFSQALGCYAFTGRSDYFNIAAVSSPINSNLRSVTTALANPFLDNDSTANGTYGDGGDIIAINGTGSASVNGGHTTQSVPDRASNIAVAPSPGFTFDVLACPAGTQPLVSLGAGGTALTLYHMEVNRTVFPTS